MHGLGKIGSKIILVAAFSITSFSFSQDKTGWGLNVGVSQNSFRGNDYSELFEFRTGFLLGVGNRVKIGPNINLNMDFNYEYKAIELEPIIQLGSEELTFLYLNRYHFLNLPITFDVPFGPKKDWFFEIGGYMNFQLGESLEIETVIPRFKDLDYGLASGLGKVFTVNDSMDMVIGLRYELGLVNTAKEVGVAPAPIDVRSSSIKLLLTWVFAK